MRPKCPNVRPLVSPEITERRPPARAAPEMPRPMKPLAFACALAALLPLKAVAQVRAADAGLERRSVVDGPFPIDPEVAPRPVLRALRTTATIRIDGVVDEAAWADAEVATGFIQSRPDTGEPVSERTEVRFLYDDEKLYIGAVMYDRHPELLIAQRMEQDFLSPDEDVFGFALDTFLDRSNAYYIFVNPNGALRDAQAYDNSRTSNAEWEGVMEVDATIHDQGWSAEIAIPFTTLRFDPRREDQVWGLNMIRRVRRRGEDALWAPVAFRNRVHKMDEAGTLVGLEGLRAGRNITLKPYVVGTEVGGSVPPEGDRGASGDYGLDMKWGITSRLTADLTWRTDFSQVEVDQEQVNLTRFGLFFPEKREFFVESSGTYAFGDLAEREYRLGASPRDFTLFHSRRIGLEGGRPVPILGGGRLTGRVAGMQIGFLDMQTERTATLAPENFSVARVRGVIGETLHLGGIVINRQATEGPESYNRSWGVDANAYLLRNLILHSYVAETYEPGVSDDNRAWRASAAWRDELWDVSALYRSFDARFDPGVGFVQRPGTRHTYATVGVHPRPPIPSVLQVNPYVEAERFVAPEGWLQTRNLVAGLGVLFLDGGSLTLTGTDRYEGLDEDFVLSEGVVPAGRYDFREASLSYTSSAARKLSGTARVSGGGYFQGDRRSFGGGVIWRPSAHFAFDLGVDHNRIDLTGETFTVDVLSGRVDWAYSTRLFLGAWVQYNDASHELVSNVRLNFLHAPLSDLFLVYQERRDTDGGGVRDRRLSAKLTRLFAF